MMTMITGITLIFALAVIIKGDNVSPANPLEEQVLGLLNKWRKGGVQTNLFPLPSLRAVNIDQVDSYYDGKGIKMSFSIGEMELTGLDNFSIEKLRVTETADNINISTQVKIPILTLHTDNYKLKGRAYYIYPLHGFGNMTVVFKDSDISVNVRFANVNGRSTRIDDFSLEFNIRKIEANLENSSWPINNVLNSEGVEILESYHDEILNAIWGSVVPYANVYLANITPKNFVKIISDISLNSYVTDDSQ